MLPATATVFHHQELTLEVHIVFQMYKLFENGFNGAGDVFIIYSLVCMIVLPPTLTSVTHHSFGWRKKSEAFPFAKSQRARDINTLHYSSSAAKQTQFCDF